VNAGFALVRQIAFLELRAAFGADVLGVCCFDPNVGTI
jgi:hypothetical protein